MNCCEATLMLGLSSIGRSGETLTCSRNSRGKVVKVLVFVCLERVHVATISTAVCLLLLGLSALTLRKLALE